MPTVRHVLYLLRSERRVRLGMVLGKLRPRRASKVPWDASAPE